MMHHDVLKVVLCAFVSTIILSTTPNQYASAQTNQTNQQDNQQGDTRRAAHSERISIELSNTSTPIDADTITVTLDGEPYSAYELQDNNIIFTLPDDISLSHSHVVIKTDQEIVEQTFEFVASFGSSNLIALVEGQTESQFRRYVNAMGMQLTSFFTVLGGDLSLAEVQLNEQSSAQGLQQLHTMQQLASQTAAAPMLWVSSPQMLYKPLRRIHSLDPSCALWPELQDVTRQWRPLFLEADSGQADVLEALSVPRAHARGDSGQGVNVFVLDSASESNDRFTCANANIQGHGRHIQTIIQAIAPAANIVPLPVCDASGECLTQEIAKALLSLQNVLTTGNPTIVTLALGSPPHPELGIDAVIYHSLERLSARYDNLLVVASAGNNGLDGNYQSITARFPAGFWQDTWQNAQGTPLAPLDNIISVGGIGLQASRSLIDYNVTPFNPQVPISMLAPAARVCLPHPSGGCAPNGSEQGLTGSSFAAPFVSGAAALFWEACPELSASDLRAWLLRDSNFDILIDGEQPNIPVVNAFRTEGCPEVGFDALPSEPVTLEPLSLAIKQRYVLEPRLPAGDNTANSANYLQRQLADHLSAHFNPSFSRRTVWRSSDPTIASINTNRVHAHAAGEVTLSLYLSDDTYAEKLEDTSHLAQANTTSTSVANAADNDNDVLLAQVTLTVLPYACTDPPVIGDAALAERMAEPERWGSPLTCDVMAQAERLFAMELGITDLTGLEYAPNLRWLNLGENPLHEGGEGVLEPLSHLRHLETLYLFDSGLDERHLPPLNALANLNLLSLHENNISNIDVLVDATFTDLETLWLYHNDISDITPLRRLTKLHTLKLEGNRIHDLSPLQGLRKLITLNLAGNAVENIDPLANLTNLDTLILFGNAITEVQGLANLSNLRNLDLKYNAVSDLQPLAGLTELSLLELAQNPIDTIEPLRNLTLDLLDISGSTVSDLSPVGHMSLATLRAAYTNVRDITPLSGMQNLTELDVAGNIGLGTPAETLEVLETLINLRHLDVSLTGLPADGLAPLTDLAALQTLSASSNQLSDLEPLRNLPRLTHLDLRSNHITNLRPLAENLALSSESSIRLTGNDLLFHPQDALADIDALQARGIHLEIEDIQNGLPATHLVRFMQGEQVMNSRAPNNRDNRKVVLEHTPHATHLDTQPDSASKQMWFEMFAPGNYRTTQHANQGWMLRLRGTTLCVSANTPYSGMAVTLWRCLPDDPWQQWQLRHVNTPEAVFPTEPSLAANRNANHSAPHPTPEQGHWQLVMTNHQGDAYCVTAETSNDTDANNTGNASSNVIMWRCEEVTDSSQWRVEVAPVEVLSDAVTP